MEAGYFINELGSTSLTALEAESPTLTCFISSPPGENLIAEDIWWEHESQETIFGPGSRATEKSWLPFWGDALFDLRVSHHTKLHFLEILWLS